MSKFRNDQFFQLESYLENQIGKSVPNFLEKLKVARIDGLLEAVPMGSPYKFQNGIYSADIGYVDRKNGVLLDIEIDEDHHFTDFEQWKRDKHRNNYYSEQGWTVVRFSESEIIGYPELCIQDIINLILEIKADFSNFFNKLRML